MTKAEARTQLIEDSFASGNVQYELLELDKLQCKSKTEAIETISVTCGQVLTIICC